MRALRLMLGVLLCLVGLVFVPLPGPGFLVVAAGAATLAGESRRLAQRLDRAELWLRARLPRRR